MAQSRVSFIASSFEFVEVDGGGTGVIMGF